MTLCNQCGSPMVPDDTGLIPALLCVNDKCRRMIPRTHSTRDNGDRRQLNRALRAARRKGMTA